MKKPIRVIIDGRAAGLSESEFMRGLGRARGVGKMPTEYIAIFADGKIKRWP